MGGWCSTRLWGNSVHIEVCVCEVEIEVCVKVCGDLHLPLMGDVTERGKEATDRDTLRAFHYGKCLSR